MFRPYAARATLVGNMARKQMFLGLRLAAFREALRLIDCLPRRQSNAALPAHLMIGKAGEEAAFLFLRKEHYTVVAHGWQSGRAPGDLDLVAWDGEQLCFVEVKTRSSRYFATAEAAIDEHKRHTLRRLAKHYLRQLPAGTSSRFDVVSVYLRQGHKAEFELFRNAFGW